MSDPEIDALARDARQHQRTTTGAACARCGTRDHLSPTSDDQLQCYACKRASQGARPTEVDHLAGRRNVSGLTANLLANDHRTVTEWRTRLGLDAWPDADGDPLLFAAHVLAGVATLILLVADWLITVAEDVAASLGAPGWANTRAFPVVP